jgi:hypothetical protein
LLHEISLPFNCFFPHTFGIIEQSASELVASPLNQQQKFVGAKLPEKKQRIIGCIDLFILCHLSGGNELWRWATAA